LERSVRELFGSAPVSLSRSAVGHHPGQATLYYRPRLSVVSSLYREPQVDSQSAIDAMLREAPPDYPHRFSPRVRRLLRPLMGQFLTLISTWLAAKIIDIPCEITTVSQVIRASAVDRIDLLKIDVEGAELEVLLGIAADDWPKIQAVAAEIHDLDNRVQTVRELLESAGFDRIEFSQEWPFEGTSVYMLDAKRTPDGPAT
jgi:hypothetical protein